MLLESVPLYDIGLDCGFNDILIYSGYKSLEKVETLSNYLPALELVYFGGAKPVGHSDYKRIRQLIANGAAHHQKGSTVALGAYPQSCIAKR